MAAITLITSTPFLQGPETYYEYYSGLIPGEGWINIGRIRTAKERRVYLWTAKGSQGDRDLPAEQLSLAGFTLLQRNFTPAPGSDVSTLADGTVYGTYMEAFEKDGAAQYFDSTNNTWVDWP